MEVQKATSTAVAPTAKNPEKKYLTEAEKTYGRGKKIYTRSIRDRKLRSNLKSLESKYKDATLQAKDAEILLENQGGFLEPEGELEKTYKVRQDEIKQDIGVETAKKGFELKLEDMGPYTCDYTRNGRKLLLAGRKGHVATMDWRGGKLGCELQLGETVRDAKWLHNDQFFAVAQKKYVYIYDQAGVELHCLDKHIEATNLEFLPYHFLLASVVSLHIFQEGAWTILTCILGYERISKIHRHLNRPTGRRTFHPTRLADLHVPKPSQRHPPRRASKRNSHPLVPQLINRSREDLDTPRTRPLGGRRSTRSVHGINRPGHEDGSMGYPHVQGSPLILCPPARVFRCDQ